MTTRVLVTNFGPHKIEAGANNQPLDTIYPQSYKEYYVWDERVIIVREQKEAEPAP